MQLWNALIFLIGCCFACIFILFSLKLIDCTLQSLNDGTPDVRDSAFSVLAAVAKVVFHLRKILKNYCFKFSYYYFDSQIVG